MWCCCRLIRSSFAFNGTTPQHNERKKHWATFMEISKTVDDEKMMQKSINIKDILTFTTLVESREVDKSI
ncbi:CLUMA_CG016722, isoform A [Clunio marinus]|uniref:CLUMA_CG016722, isoform A n=1 Tax=Clunio marinus TaxID=568069 RepID=A0A1J1IS90_9DIPT|nr:CLUMA_CG016722, isoform A [Clunio marinus]